MGDIASQDDIEHRFKFHPATAATGPMHDAIRGICGELAAHLNETLPNGREKALAITHLEEVMMWSNAAIARGYAGIEGETGSDG